MLLIIQLMLKYSDFLINFCCNLCEKNCDDVVDDCSECMNAFHIRSACHNLQKVMEKGFSCILSTFCSCDKESVPVLNICCRKMGVLSSECRIREFD